MKQTQILALLLAIIGIYLSLYASFALEGGYIRYVINGFLSGGLTLLYLYMTHYHAGETPAYVFIDVIKNFKSVLTPTDWLVIVMGMLILLYNLSRAKVI